MYQRQKPEHVFSSPEIMLKEILKWRNHAEKSTPVLLRDPHIPSHWHHESVRLSGAKNELNADVYNPIVWSNKNAKGKCSQKHWPDNSVYSVE